MGAGFEVLGVCSAIKGVSTIETTTNTFHGEVDVLGTSNRDLSGTRECSITSNLSTLHEVNLSWLIGWMNRLLSETSA